MFMNFFEFFPGFILFVKFIQGTMSIPESRVYFFNKRLAKNDVSDPHDFNVQSGLTNILIIHQQEPDNEPVINRLTDVSQYPGTHK